MEELLRKANTSDAEALWHFYAEVCAAQAESPYTPSWHLGIYPAREDLEEHIAAGALYFHSCGGRIAAAAVLSAGEDPIYADAAWPTACCCNCSMIRSKPNVIWSCVMGIPLVHFNGHERGIRGMR